MSPALPCVYCYAFIVGLDGVETLIRYIVVGDDQEAAAAECAERFRTNGAHIRQIETFAGEPLLWRPTTIVRPFGQVQDFKVES